MNRSDLRRSILEGAEELGVEISFGQQAMALLALELLSNDQVEAIGGLIDEGVRHLRNGEFDELEVLIRSIGGTKELTEQLIGYVRTADQHPDG